MADSKVLTVCKSDIKKIGHTTCEGWKGNHDSAGKTCICCNIGTANIEEILLRNILSLYGYKIKAADDHDDFDESVGTIFITDMPWDEYMAL